MPSKYSKEMVTVELVGTVSAMLVVSCPAKPSDFFKSSMVLILRFVNEITIT